MTGQEKNIEIITKWRLRRSIPRFIIIEGAQGSGRLTLSKVIINQLGATGVISDITKGAVKEIIDNSYTVTTPTVYIFEDADEMSNEAKNALLKVIEEPPNKAYFIMTIQNKSNMLDTILSRGALLKMQPYTKEQLKQYTEDDNVLMLASTVGDCKEYTPEMCRKAIDLASNILSDLVNKSGTNLLKDCTQLKNKDTETDKVEPKLLVKAFMLNIRNDLTFVKYLPYIVNTNRLLQYKSVNKKALVESMFVSILKELKE